MNIGLLIKNRRLEMGLTQDELAKKCGYRDRTMISKIEMNDTDIPVSKLKTIAEALECDPNYLMGYNNVFKRGLDSDAAVSDVELLSKIAILDNENKRMVSEILDIFATSQYSKWNQPK